MSGRSKKRPARELTLNKAVSQAMLIFVWAFASEFSPEQSQFDRLAREISSVRDSILCGALTIPDIRRALKQDYDWEVS